MKNIIVRKTFKYSPIEDGKSKYESYNSITLQINSPPIIEKNAIIKTFPIEFIYCSDLLRAKQSADVYAKVTHCKVTSESFFREVRFSLKALVTAEEYNTYGSVLVRQRFVDGFINDTLAEKRTEIVSRILEIEHLIKNCDYKNILIVSHSFFMKLFEAYSKDKIKIFSDPQKLRTYILPTKKTYEFGEGFKCKLY